MKMKLTKTYSNFSPFLSLMAMFVFSAAAFGQTVTISGVVTDGATADPLPGVSVVLKGTSTGTSTDFDGNYQIEANMGDVLIFSYIGFERIEITVTSTNHNVSLNEDLQRLDEVVVIGYGTTTVKDATGSVASITAEEFNQGNIVTPENLLNGRVAGVSINTGGEPGSGSTIRIRGGSSLGASNDPLIVIDGLPIDNVSIGGSRSILSTINPNEIESFSVLKDASATAIYGSRASNGVIIISTKKGKRELSVDLNMSIGSSVVPNTLDVFSADEYRQLVSNERPDLVPLLGNAKTRWQDEIYRSALTSNQNLSIQGSLLKKVPARLSIGRTLQDGLRLTSEFERNSGSLSLNPNMFNDHLKVSLNVNGSFEKNRFAPGEEGNAIRFDPTQPVYDEKSPFGGYFQYTNINDDGVLDENDLVGLAPFNPVANLLQRNDISEVKRFYGNLKLDYSFHFLPELSAVVNLGYDEQRAEGDVKVSNLNPLTQNDGSIVGSESNYTNYQKNVLLDGYLRYDKDGDRFDFDLTTGYSFQKFDSNQYTSGELLDDGADTAPVLNIDPDLVLIGLFARTNISWADKYLLTLSYRRDGTSRFSEDNRWGNFPAAAFAWQISDEFFPEARGLSTLKLRLGWGITGQQDIGRANSALFRSRYVQGLPASQYQFGGVNYPVGIPSFRNENIKWEETVAYNAGIDFGFAEDRITGSIDAFYKESKDLLANADISDGSNFSNSGFQNIGNFTSQGIEFAIGGDVVESAENDGFNWVLNYNATYIETEIQELALDQDQLVGDIGGGVGNTIQINRVGYTPYSFYVYRQVYNAQGNPIEGAYADLNGDNIINNDDRYIFKNGAPDITMGLLSNMGYKSFDLTFSLRASLGNYVYNNVNSAGAQLNLIQNNSVLSNLPVTVTDTNFTNTPDVILSDYYMENASFLKVDNISLGYTFDDVLNSRSTLRLFSSVQNVLTITNYSGLDPEVFDNGIDNTIYPRARTILLGANLRF
ncbi:iron complex outermembrane receptor protein [Saonia flava]|uniref:Iron complex outermembrane receptor protein n=1 Tax=Saonia flava TaxID=523696 RepID=A0A846QZ84_9FLAO|nr:SusC/RagA family TonB-linked outer membrane protein [Saonia flava]NJB71952.1 iron complex outermembrane receptor protein [Saonia flava]